MTGGTGEQPRGVSLKSASRRVGAIQRHLVVKDDKTGVSKSIPVSEGNTFKASDLKAFGVRPYDPGYTNTTAVKSCISYIDGGKGILRYRGYPIEELASKADYLDVAHLVIYGEFPTRAQSQAWAKAVASHASIPKGVEGAIASLPRDAHPMSAMCVGLSALGTFFPDANPAIAGNGVYDSKAVQDEQILRILGAAPAIAACAYHMRSGRKPFAPKAGLSYGEQFLYLLDSNGDQSYMPHPDLAKAIDVLFILHAEHEMNCSTAACRHLASSGVDVYTSVAGAVGALYGPLHGGANEAVLRMLDRIGDKSNVPAFIERVKAREEKLFGFGHRVYKNFDPRAKVIRGLVDQVFRITESKDPLLEVAEALMQTALKDDYFVSRKLYPNVDFFSGIIYRAMGFPPEFFTCLFAVPRLVGYLAHWKESLADPDTKILRPQQDYQGVWLRHFAGSLPSSAQGEQPEVVYSNEDKRRHKGSHH